jgi:hypothetical protein
VKVFGIKTHNHEEHEGHEEIFVKNFVSFVFFVVNIVCGGA